MLMAYPDGFGDANDRVAIIFLVISKLLACVIQILGKQKIQSKSKQ